MLMDAAQPFPFTAAGTSRPLYFEKSLATSASLWKSCSGACSQRPNNMIQRTVWVDTLRAYARVAPTHPAAERERYPALLHADAQGSRYVASTRTQG